MKLRKNSKKKSSYASNKIEGNPLNEEQAFETAEQENHQNMEPEQETRNYYLALTSLDEKLKKHEPFSMAFRQLFFRFESGQKFRLFP